MASTLAEAHQNAERAQRRLANLHERTRLMQAHYAGAVPLDLLKTEMTRLTRAMADAEHQITSATADLASSEQTLEDALTVASQCHHHYNTAPEAIKRQINQGLLPEAHHQHRRQRRTSRTDRTIRPTAHTRLAESHTRHRGRPRHAQAPARAEDTERDAPGAQRRPGTPQERAGRRYRW